MHDSGITSLMFRNQFFRKFGQSIVRSIPKLSDTRSLWQHLGTMLQLASTPADTHSASTFATFVCDKIGGIRATYINFSEPNIHYRVVPTFGDFERFKEVTTDEVLATIGAHK